MIAEPTVTATVQEQLLAQGVLYRALGESFAYPTPERLQAWQDGSALEAIAEAIHALDEPELQAALEQLEQSLSESEEAASAISRLVIASGAKQSPFNKDEIASSQKTLLAMTPVETASRPTLEEEYTFLFQRQTAASPYEGSYLVQGFFMQPHMLADVGAFYSAFGFQVAGDLSDHLGAELEFMAVVCLKEAYAHERGWVEQAETCAQARRRFLAEHIGRWLPVFAMRVRDNARLPFYAALTDLTAAFVAFDCKSLGVTPDRTGVFVPEPAQTAQVEQDDGTCAA